MFSEYLVEIQKIFSSGNAREHAYRPAFQNLIENICPELQVINEPAYTGGNAPDFLFKKGDTPIAYGECKDVTVEINNKDVQRQAKRYKDAFGKILLTNYYDFEIIEEGKDSIKFSIARKEDEDFIPLSENFTTAKNLISDYMTPSHRSIKSASKLAEIMAKKARILKDSAQASLKENPNSDIYKQYETFKKLLIRDLSPEDFADMYAQTLVYGLFVARYYDPTLPTFSRYEAQDLLPKNNPLLKKFFGHVAGTDYDPKISWIVDSLIEAYLCADVHGIMHREFSQKKKDPILHFYETFLGEYDQKLRKSRGVYYTPEPVVSFIVRGVDHLLKTKFDLPQGIADTSKIKIKEKISKVDARTKDGVAQVEKEIHKVQILDPAIGTGTFLNEVIHEISRKFVGQEGLWQSYASEHLLPRLHGFELMMASYTMAHLKLGITLAELGYKGDERLSVWLTNSLEEGVHEVPQLFMSQWITDESNAASKIKSETPVMVVVGNPPYSVSSSNKGEHILKLIADYKKNLNERNIQPLSDDYIKFIRFAENQIEKTGEGISAMITNNSFIDGITHRQMRNHLMETFDEIYILDLHGNAKKKETAPDGSKDDNVFDIMQGVSINIFVKKKKIKGDEKKLATVFHTELFGKRAQKYKNLEQNFNEMPWEKLEVKAPYYFFVPKDFAAEEEYEKGFGVEEIFGIKSSGVQTQKDKVAIQFSKEKMEKIILDFENYTEDKFRANYDIGKDNNDWSYESAKLDILSKNAKLTNISYRPFDIRYTKYSGKKGLMGRHRNEVMQHFVGKENLGLQTCNQQSSFDFQHILISKYIVDRNSISLQTKESTKFFPLYLYHPDGTKTPNLDKKIIKKFEKQLGMNFDWEEGRPQGYAPTDEKIKISPENILDYIYAVLHSPKYREKYKEFLKINFPRIPYPADVFAKNVGNSDGCSLQEKFFQLVDLGKKIRKIHLLESTETEKYITTFPENGDNILEKKFPKFIPLEDTSNTSREDKKSEKILGNVYINQTQYFGNVPKTAWEFYIGGYQPAQKWLKDRKENVLSFEDILHWQKIIVALSRTNELMKEVDEVLGKNL